MATSLKISDDLKGRIQQLARVQDRTPHWIMMRAINEYVSKEEKKEQFKQEALASWQSFKETGLHITGDEAVRWLQTWGTDSEEPAPKCHK
ncbi:MULTISPECIES: CopG family ribbon-helix-helix protein [Cysteiniphilum]|uniref:CopG family ribbon-helix-helix protein n=1 Tax=Cysteiniphilum TaxID=2056696 RepID=UPI00178150A3|nr:MULTISPECIES: CopG family ribbon-helix-helix protein [Cysteiniphilum]